MDGGHEIEWCLLLGRKDMTNLNSVLESRDITLMTKVHIVKSSGFSNSHVWVWELDHKESWTQMNWYFWTVGLENILESPLDYMDINPVNPKENQSWIFIERTDAEAETPVLWPPDAKNWLIGKDPDAGKDWGWEEKGMTEDEMVGSPTIWWPPTRWTWVWVNSGSWWWTGRPGVLQSMGSQSRTRLSDWTEPNHVWDLPGLETESVSLVLQRGFSSTGPPRQFLI